MKDFLLINDIQQILNTKVFGGGPWMHLATISLPIKMVGNLVKPYREYLCIKNLKTNNIYIEELDLTYPGILKKIKDDSLFNELAQYLTAKGVLSFGVNKEFKIAKKN